MIAVEENSPPPPYSPPPIRPPTHPLPTSMYSQCPKNIRRLSHPLGKHGSGAIFHARTDPTWGWKDISLGRGGRRWRRVLGDIFASRGTSSGPSLLLERFRTANIPPPPPPSPLPSRGGKRRPRFNDRRQAFAFASRSARESAEQERESRRGLNSRRLPPRASVNTGTISRRTCEREDEGARSSRETREFPEDK